MFQSGFLRNIDSPPDKSMTTWSLHTDTTPAEPNQIQLECVKGHPFIWPAYNMRWDIARGSRAIVAKFRTFFAPIYLSLSLFLLEVTYVGWLALGY